jgi:hypothetical protein
VQPCSGDYNVSGTINPDATGNYTENGIFNGFPAYELNGGGFWLYYQAGVNNYRLAICKGMIAHYWFNPISGTVVPGNYTPNGTHTGTAIVTAL